MKNLQVLVTAALTLACIGCAQAPPAADTKGADTKAADVAAIKALEDRFTAAFNAMDVNAIMAVYVPDDSLVAFDATPPRQYSGAQAYRKDWEGLVAMFPSGIKFDMSDLDITAGGDVAYSHSIQHVIGVMKDGKKMEFTVRVTDGYKKTDGQWLISHEHVSWPVDIETGKADLLSKP